MEPHRRDHLLNINTQACIVSLWRKNTVWSGQSILKWFLNNSDLFCELLAHFVIENIQLHLLKRLPDITEYKLTIKFNPKIFKEMYN